MNATTMGIKLDEATRERIKNAARRIDRTPHWLIKQAVFHYLERLEGAAVPEIPALAATEEPVAGDAPPEESHQPFLDFALQILPQSVSRAAVTAACRRPEPECVALMLEQARMSEKKAQAIQTMAAGLAGKLRQQKSGFGPSDMVQGLLQEFSLSSQEGVALMCLAEALLRIPDQATRDALIRDKIGGGDWHAHLGRSPSLFVNAAAWGLLLTGKLVSTRNGSSLSHALSRIVAKSGEPLIRKGVNMAMRLMGEQFVIGENIAEALANASPRERKGFRYSYDMLGEAALTEADAQRCLASYAQAIDAIGKASGGKGIYEGPGISIKLSALHPRYSRAQYDRVTEELYPRLRSLTLQARRHDVGINIDAEEADRLEISLDLLEKLCFEPELEGWNGIGFVVQAYQKRCLAVADALVDLAARSARRLMIRLVKGAYWDSEIKRAQTDGLEGYPVYTRKAYSDVSYLACARKLLSVPQLVYPQFATHNAHTLSAVFHIAGNNYYPGQYEFQCLHGMGEALYDHVTGPLAEGRLNRPCRIYAPVGAHETLLAYLARRLLENGANTSFVNRIADPAVSLEELTADPFKTVEAMAAKDGRIGLPHPQIPLPRDMYGPIRLNAQGLDLSNEHRLASLSSTLLAAASRPLRAEPAIDAALDPDAATRPIVNPAEPNDVVGLVREASLGEVDRALEAAAAQVWPATPPAERAAVLDRAAVLMEGDMQNLIGLLAREAGKTFGNAIAEVREATDFLRYYAAQTRSCFSNADHRPLGPVLCISPWNFPLAIFTGQIAAALAAGNAALAKPAEQTPLIAAQAVRLLHQAGVPPSALQLLPGPGEIIGEALAKDPRVRGIVFTGSTEVADILRRRLAGRLDSQGRPIPLIAETGGQNAMIVDSSALTEQATLDVLASAFDSAGQRCSALRLLCLQEDVAERTLHMLRNAMAECRMGNPERLSTDVGPVIDAEARERIERHIETMRAKGRAVFQAARRCPQDEKEWARGVFVMPTLIELESLDDLQSEVFGPVLHAIRFKRADLDALIDRINDLGYGLTLGVHTRIDETVRRVVGRARVGNLYVNRTIVGAVVGVQPFGGEGLSGTGPKAGGPLYLYRLLSRRPDASVRQALSGLEKVPSAEIGLQPTGSDALEALESWAARNGRSDLVPVLRHYAAFGQDLVGTRLLSGPTGERNVYALLPRRPVLCMAEDEADALRQLGAVLAMRGHVLWPDADPHRALSSRLPPEVKACIASCPAEHWAKERFDAVLFHGDSDRLRRLSKELALRGGPIAALHGFAPGKTDIPLERLLIERSLSVNTAAAGGNAGLTSIG